MIGCALLLAALSTASAAEPIITAEPLPDYELLFGSTRGWIGADGAFSVPLGKDRILWLFSDTFVGEVRDGRRVNAVMINNSIAIQRLGPEGGVDYFYSTDPDGRPASFVTPEDGHGYFWLFAGAAASDGLFIFLPHIEHYEAGGVFPFKTIGMGLGHVSNPQDPPVRWRITQRRLPFCRYEEKGSLYFGSAVLHDGGHIYIYGQDSTRKDSGGNARSATVLARAPADRFGEFSLWRFYSDGEWVTNFTLCGAVSEGWASEHSVSYVPGVGRYAAVYTAMGITGVIVARLADRPEGPWSEPVKLYECPDRNRRENTYSYAAKAHPELAEEPNELIVTYATNSMHFPDLMEDAEIYLPRFVRVRIDNSKSDQRRSQ